MDQPNEEQMQALQRFATKYGRCWKSKLRDVWLDDPVMPDDGLLRQIRNELGPRWLIKFKLKLEKP